MKKTYSKYIVKAPVLKTAKELLDHLLHEIPNHVAFEYLDHGEVKEVTTAEFYTLVNSLGSALCELGLNDKHISMIGANSFKYVVVYLTGLCSSGVFNPIDKEITPTDICNVLVDAESSIVFYDEKYEKLFQEQQDDRLKDIQYFVGLDRKEDDGRFLSFEKLLQRGKELYLSGDRRFWNSSRGERSLALLPYTSGTTGMMKGVMLSEHNVMACCCYGLFTSVIYTKCLSMLPFNHTFEAVSGLLSGLLNQTTICINDNIRHVQKNLQLFKPDYLFMVPAFAELFYKKIWANVKQKGKDKSLKFLLGFSKFLRFFHIDLRRKLFKSVLDVFGGNVKTIMCGGAPLRLEVADFYCDIGIDLCNGYGITECSPLVSVNQPHFIHNETVGFKVPCVQLKIAEPDEEGIGEVCVQGDTVMMGYYHQPEMTKEVLSEDGWFRTGDYGKINKYGQLMITGRKKNLIILDNGKNIFPEEIEMYITAIPYVDEAIVFGLKDEHGMENALAVEIYASEDKLKVYGIENLEEALKKDIPQACKELVAYKQISKIFIRPVPFEKTATNKIKRTSLMFKQ